jgi:REP element-mobilizing transposase RayT
MRRQTTTDQSEPHAGTLRKGRYSHELGLYLVTKCTEAGSLLTEAQRTDLVLALRHFRARGEMRLHAFVVMPDHWHALLSLGTGKTLGQLVHAVDRHASFGSRQRGTGILWEREYHDHKVRPMETVTDIIRYVEGNPVRKGLVLDPAEWLWSSAHPGNADMLDRAFLGPERWEE